MSELQASLDTWLNRFDAENSRIYQYVGAYLDGGSYNLLERIYEGRGFTLVAGGNAFTGTRSDLANL
jgi:hypothetical protein